MERELPKRKQIRWDKRDYSEARRYFITVCTEGRKPILSRFISVGDGALDVPSIELTKIGAIAEKYLLSSEKIDGVHINRYVIMPNHIHFLRRLRDVEGAVPYRNNISTQTDHSAWVLALFLRFIPKYRWY